MIHPTAIISDSVVLGDNVSVGAYAIVRENCKIGNDTIIEEHAIIGENTTLGNNNRVFPKAVIGLAAQDKKFSGEDSSLEIGNNNTFREFCTVNKGTAQNDGKTIIGDNNLFLAYTHIAHDCILGNDIVISNNANLAGHVILEDFVVISGFVGVHQFSRIGCHSFIGMGAMIRQDIPCFLIVADNPTVVRGINKEGMSRRGFSKEQMKLARTVYKMLYKDKVHKTKVIEYLKSYSEDDVARSLLHFFAKQRRNL